MVNDRAVEDDGRNVLFTLSGVEDGEEGVERVLSSLHQAQKRNISESSDEAIQADKTWGLWVDGLWVANTMMAFQASGDGERLSACVSKGRYSKK